jgi:hypothetical protein
VGAEGACVKRQCNKCGESQICKHNRKPHSVCSLYLHVFLVAKQLVRAPSSRTYARCAGVPVLASATTTALNAATRNMAERRYASKTANGTSQCQPMQFRTIPILLFWNSNLHSLLSLRKFVVQKSRRYVRITFGRFCARSAGARASRASATTSVARAVARTEYKPRESDA